MLIDEYDSPLLSCLHEDKEKFDGVRKELIEFYSSLKAIDSEVRLAFITGIVSFRHLGLLVGDYQCLNNIVDISQEMDAAELVGYTRK